MTWAPPRTALQMIGQKKLAELTNDAGKQEYVGVGDASNKVFPTPFYFVADVKIYADAVLVDPGCTLSIASDGQVTATFATEPGAGVVITGSSLAAVNGDNLDLAFLRAQGDVRGMVDAALYETPPDDAVNVPSLILGWAAAIAWYYLATDPRRARLLEAYPEIEKRYIDVFGGVDATLKRVAKGTFSLRGVLSYRGAMVPFSPPSVTPTPEQSEFTTRERVYGDGRGVF